MFHFKFCMVVRPMEFREQVVIYFASRPKAGFVCLTKKLTRRAPITRIACIPALAGHGRVQQMLGGYQTTSHARYSLNSIRTMIPSECDTA